MSATVTSGFDRWRDDQSASAANDDAIDASRSDVGPHASTDPDAPIAPNDAPADDPNADPADPNDPSAAKRLLPYAPFAKQCDFHKSPAKYRLFGGAAGPGKSMALLMEAVVQANDNHGSNTLLLRRTFPELEQSLLLYFRKEIPRELYSSFNDSKHVVTWLNGSTTRFGYCAAENDVYQYQGAEFLFIGIDELTLFTLRQWQFLTSRNRCPIARTFPNMAGATNPGNIGHAWVKALWIDKQPAAGMENPECYDPADYDFISARVHDNPIYAADQNYLKTLAALPSHLRRAFLDGDWEVFAGQYFDNFDVTRHIARAETIDWRPWWPRWISIDWGFEHPSATYWHAAAPGAAFRNADGSPSSSTGIPACANVTSHRDRTSQAPNATSFFPPLSSPSSSSSSSHQPISNNDANAPSHRNASNVATGGTGRNACATQTVITYREYVTHRTAPRDLAHEIIARCLASSAVISSEACASQSHSPYSGTGPAGRRDRENDACTPLLSRNPPDSRATSHPHTHEKIDAIYLSPDAFARRTDEASIADQMGDVFTAAGFPRPIPADNDRIGGWMLMYQMLNANEWLLTDNCIELIRTIPTLVRDMARIEDIEKMDGDDPADAARYGLKSRYATRAAYSIEHLPYEARLAARVLSADPTVRAIQARKAQLEEHRRTSYVPRRRR
jgi:Terminase large subunit, T4likevirus-type, N-terminal